MLIGTAVLFISSGCSSTTTPLSPTTSTTAAATAAPGTSLKATSPVAQSPVNDQQVTALTTTLVATAATPQFATITLQYRFQVFNDTGTLVLDSGLQNAPTWAEATVLTPLKRYTWRVRAEYQGAAGAWSAAASFRTPEQPNTYTRPIGNWQACAPLRKVDLVTCVAAAVNPTDAVSLMEVVKRVAWLLRGEGGGLLIKTGENSIVWQGYNLSISRICFPDGHIYKLFQDAGTGGSNAPIYADNDFVDPTLYVPAIDPAKP